jgi:pimeloyl-ACP methyl ester carboxylesterase
VPELTTNDGVRLVYQDLGEGRPVVMVPGISQPASLFTHQVAGLRDRSRVIVYDQRGHGASEKPPHGYRIARLAKDLDDLMERLGLEDVTLLGWSLGCAVAWSYYDMFGPKRLGRLILVEGTVRLCRAPEMTEQDVADTGAAWDAAGAAAVVDALRRDQETVTRQLAAAFFTDRRAEADRIVAEMLRTPAAAVAALMFDYVFTDWRDVIPRIDLPTLIVGGARSHVPISVQEWLHRTIPGSRLAVLQERAHLLFYEEPETFNELVARFVG